MDINNYNYIASEIIPGYLTRMHKWKNQLKTTQTIAFLATA